MFLWGCVIYLFTGSVFRFVFVLKPTLRPFESGRDKRSLEQSHLRLSLRVPVSQRSVDISLQVWWWEPRVARPPDRAATLHVFSISSVGETSTRQGRIWVMIPRAPLKITVIKSIPTSHLRVSLVSPASLSVPPVCVAAGDGGQAGDYFSVIWKNIYE